MLLLQLFGSIKNPKKHLVMHDLHRKHAFFFIYILYSNKHLNKYQENSYNHDNYIRNITLKIKTRKKKNISGAYNTD